MLSADRATAPEPDRDGPNRAYEYFERLREAFLEATRVAVEQQHWFALNGRTIQLRFAGDALISSTCPALEHLRTRPTTTPALTIALWDSETTGVRVPTVRRSDIGPQLGPRGLVLGLTDDKIRTEYIEDYGGLSMLDSETSTGIFWARSAEEIPWYARARPLRTLFHWAFSAERSMLVHAGAVATSAGAALLTGPGGSGKSTTSVACFEAGLDYLGDDDLLLDLEGDPHVYSLYTTAKLAPRTLELIPTLDHTAITVEHGDKLVLDLHGRRAERLRRSAPVTAIVLPRVTGGPTFRLRPASGAEALHALAPTSILRLPQRSRAALGTLSDLVRRVPCYRLELGDDISGVPAAIEELIAECAGRSAGS
jgi:hypothetical protein